MRLPLIALLFALVIASPLSAQQDEIQSTISSQFEAFKDDDFARAFTYASPNIRSIFQTPENFGRMVQQGYPMVYRPSQTRFLDLAEVEGALWQRVEITDSSGEVFYLGYQMIETEKGWKINAVTLLKSPGVSA